MFASLCLKVRPLIPPSRPRCKIILSPFPCLPRTRVLTKLLTIIGSNRSRRSSPKSKRNGRANRRSRFGRSGSGRRFPRFISRRAASANCSRWSIGWMSKRKREVFPTKEKAVAAAKSANKELGKGDLGAADLTAPQRVACARALDLLAPLGVPIEAVASEYARPSKS